jgi:hypothetical protein
MTRLTALASLFQLASSNREREKKDKCPRSIDFRSATWTIIRKNIKGPRCTKLGPRNEVACAESTVRN